MMNDCCTRCGMSLRRAMLMAMAYDAGARGNIDPLACWDERRQVNAEHDFLPSQTRESNERGEANPSSPSPGAKP